MIDTAKQQYDFFISRAGAQAPQAELLKQVLEQAQYSVYLQDNTDHGAVLPKMNEALEGSARLIVLLSQDYLDSDYCQSELTAFQHTDVLNRNKRILFPAGVTA